MQSDIPRRVYATFMPESTESPIEQTLAMLSEQLRMMRKAEEYRKAYYADLCHDMRGPLQVILGTLQMMRMAKDADDRSLLLIRALEYNGRELMQMASNLVELTKPELLRKESHMERVDVVQFAQSFVQGILPYAEHKGVRLYFRKNVRYLMVHCDTDKMDRLLYNLFSNAVRYTPEGGRIHIDVLSMGENYEIRVSDTGRGISKQALERIFDRFYTTNDTGQGGHGLGLVLVRETAMLHGGQVFVSSKEGEGSTFTVRLPRRLDVNAPVTARAPSRPERLSPSC